MARSNNFTDSLEAGLKLSKRRLLQTAGATAAVFGLSSKAKAAAPSKTWDVIVVGGGNAGLPAAIFAAKRGAKVLIVEAAAQVGGTLFLSSGQMSAAGTKLQKSKGIDDTPQSHYDDIMRISGGTADPVLVKLAVVNAAPVFDWLTDNGFEPLPGQPITGTTHEPYSHPRYAWGHEGGMSILKILMAQLQPEIDRGNVTIMLNTQVTDLIQERGAVTGVATKDDKGVTARHFGRHTVLTCGGCTYNQQMFAQYERARNYCQSTYPYSQGAGITLGLSVGGYVRGGQYHTPLFGAVLAGSDYPSPMRALVRHFPTDRPPWEIFVNTAGKRFLCEDVPSHNAYEQSLKAQPEERCWVVFDDAIFAKAPQLVTGFTAPWTQADTADAFKSGLPMFYRADTLEGLAKAAGFDAAGFAATIADYNAAQAGGQDALGRKYMPLPIAKAPFYAVQLQSWNLTDYAGIAVDGRLRVIRQDGTPVGNLYVAGELLGMGQLMGQSVCGGMSVTPALAFGRLLGHEILDLKA